MSSFESESEYDSSDAGWSSEDEIPLAPSGNALQTSSGIKHIGVVAWPNHNLDHTGVSGCKDPQT